nr:unnamed protein product [Digitaria exilis]
MLPCFTEVEGTAECTSLWEYRYEEYLGKALLYGAEEFEETARDHSVVFMEACTIYRIVYESARSTRSISKCRFVWVVAGAALCHLHARMYAMQRGEKAMLCPISVGLVEV